LLPQYIDFYKHLAQKYQIYIQPGSIPYPIHSNQYVNRAYFFGPQAQYGFQDKLQLIEYEKESNLFQAGKEQTLFETALGTIGIAICYDSEFPEIVRRLTRAGANLILVPSYTCTLAGYYRVFLSCRARALENQCYVAVTYMVGSVDLSGAPENTVGQAAILSPVDAGFPDDGIVAQGKMNSPMFIMADVDLEKLQTVRTSGQVHNYEDMRRLELSKKNNVNYLSL
jgi:predicted amidohydrolase